MTKSRGPGDHGGVSAGDRREPPGDAGPAADRGDRRSGARVAPADQALAGRSLAAAAALVICLARWVSGWH